MVPELRKKHRWIWWIGLMILPLGIYLTISNLPDPAYQVGALPDSHVPMPIVVTMAHNDQLKVVLRASPEGKHELEVLLRSPIPLPAAQVYWQNQLLGNIGPRGEMYFRIDSAQLTRPPYIFEIRNALDHTPYLQLPLVP